MQSIHLHPKRVPLKRQTRIQPWESAISQKRKSNNKLYSKLWDQVNETFLKTYMTYLANFKFLINNNLKQATILQFKKKRLELIDDTILCLWIWTEINPWPWMQTRMHQYVHWSIICHSKQFSTIYVSQPLQQRLLSDGISIQWNSTKPWKGRK